MIRDWFARLAFRLAGFRDMPGTAVLRFGPNDVLVLFHHGALSTRAIEHMRTSMRSVMGDGTKIMILEEGMKLAVLNRD